MKRLVLAGLLAGCAVRPVPAVPPPPGLASCPGAPATPAALAKVRSPEAVARFAVRLELAREAEHARGEACARALDSLNDWIKIRDAGGLTSGK